MSELYQEAIDLIQNIPEPQIVYVVSILKNISSMFNVIPDDDQTTDNPRLAYERLLRYKGSIDIDLDYKAELAKARDEKYADFI